jgi:L-iditol 2-dehydrogenase
VFGHETAGVIVTVGELVNGWRVGDRVVAYHHIPCRNCFYCDRKFYAQCPRFKMTGTTAGFAPSGGGFAEFVLAKDWIVESGLVQIPEEVTFEEATFVEPVNCCMKAVNLMRSRQHRGSGVALVFGQGAMGLVIDQLLRGEQVKVIAIDPVEERLERAKAYEAQVARPTDDLVALAQKLTDDRGADAAILATDHPSALAQAIEATRPGARIVLFATTQLGKEQQVDVGNLCVLDKRVVGCYSTSYDLQDLAANCVFSRLIDVAGLIMHRLPLDDIQEAIAIASNPSASSLKVIVNP